MAMMYSKKDSSIVSPTLFVRKYIKKIKMQEIGMLLPDNALLLLN